MAMHPEAYIALVIVQMTTAVILKLFRKHHQVDPIAKTNDGGLMRALGYKH